MRVVIVGSGDVGRKTAESLAKRHEVLLLDTSQECLKNGRDPKEALAHLSESSGVVCVHGDGTSRLVLAALYDPEIACGLVAATGHDEGNLEAGRLARDIGFDPVVAIQHDAIHAEAFHDARITVVDRPALLAAQIERSVQHMGAVVPTGIGLGKGELVEIRLLQTSPILSRPLRKLAPHRWRVAAVFRNDELLVPTGQTTLAEDDRVLLVGDPKILPTVTEYLRRGTPQFPRPFGPNVVTLESAGADEQLHKEAEWLACACGAANLVRGTPGAEDNLSPEEEEPLAFPACKGEVRRNTFSLARLADPVLTERVLRQRPGVVVVRPQSRDLWQRLLGQRGVDAQLCDRLRAPILFARGSGPYEQILLPVSESDVNIQAAEMAIDITRQLGASLTAMNVDLPQYISGIPDEVLHEEVVPIRRLCELYEVPLDYRHRHGNPLLELTEEASKHDLVVVARRKGRRDNYFDPDVALRLARRAPCSVIVLTVCPGD